eukprot:432745-Pyramimonas_sp.AAC.2
MHAYTITFKTDALCGARVGCPTTVMIPRDLTYSQLPCCRAPSSLILLTCAITRTCTTLTACVSV